jgi:hypothetical protein
MGYFPRTTEPYQRRAIEHEPVYAEPSLLRKLAFSLLDMALVTGVTLRLGRALVQAYGGTDLFVTGVAAGTLFICAMAAMHLGNFPIRHWVWRAPVFGFAVGAVEGGVSLLLISLGREPYGTGYATYSDWLSMTLSVVPWRMMVVSIFGIGLAVVVQGFRMATPQREEQL